VKRDLRTSIRVARLRAWRHFGQARMHELAQRQTDPVRPAAATLAPSVAQGTAGPLQGNLAPSGGGLGTARPWGHPEPAALAELGASLPTLERNAADLEQLFALARAHHVALTRGDYQFGNEPNATLLTYSVTLPVHQSYATIKQFSADVLRALPHAALEELRLERAEAGAADLDGRLRFTLTYRSR
jgi:hypothetical protein